MKDMHILNESWGIFLVDNLVTGEYMLISAGTSSLDIEAQGRELVPYLFEKPFVVVNPDDVRAINEEMDGDRESETPVLDNWMQALKAKAATD